MIRVTSGKYRGRSVDSPPRNKEIRPTTSLMRESIFNKLQMQLPGCRFLDLFAGSGIMGLEALSRGADFVLAIEQDSEQCRVIRKNYAHIGLSEKEVKVVPCDALGLMKKPCREAPFDFVFADPPYGFKALPELVEHCQRNGWLKPGGVMIVEHGSRDAELEGFIRKVYGDTAISIRKFEEDPSGER
ncbi:16S rRNA (guanine(966)-N(2))-methyltransferase RsmD [Vampirovibrio chlorellavorus]|uniref:16S rRNA (guanine(966)-N(2))-methyltransferase RsmD n=1 Tax=Vampirovibrio chlorellavorus TaxID=758823 RepID=UPI0026EBD128|nr:16S rRNA (guanine(966)-N(2))-methyltransferase RsmD [Vampirovibrio chlorellavorus]